MLFSEANDIQVSFAFFAFSIVYDKVVAHVIYQESFGIY